MTAPTAPPAPTKPELKTSANVSFEPVTLKPVTPAEILTTPHLRKRINEIVKMLRQRPETNNPEYVRDLVRAAALKVAFEEGKLPLLPSPSDPPHLVNARRYLNDYGEYVHNLTPTSFHLDWMEALLDPTIDRLLIIAPPNSAKTTVMAIEAACFLIGHDKNIHIGLISNVAGQAEAKSKAIRDTIAFNSKYHEVFPQITPDHAKGWAADRWFVKRNNPGDPFPTLHASGIHGNITGDRYDFIILDDPDDLESTLTKYQRDSTHTWINETLLPRLTKDGRIVTILTRYHHEDTAAWLIAHGFEVMRMPAISTDDQGNEHALWEEHMPLAKLQAIRAQEPLMFERVYQGNPTPVEGALIKEHWWRWNDPSDAYQQYLLSHADRIIQALDTASKDKTVNDFSVIMTLAMFEGNVYIIDVFRDRMQYPQLKAMAKTQALRYSPSTVVIESASSGIALFQDLQQTTSLPVIDVVADKSKVARLTGVLDYIASGRVYLPGNLDTGYVAPWVPAFLKECADFPLGDHEDMVDALVHGINELFLPRGLKKWASPTFLSLGQNAEETRKRVIERLHENEKVVSGYGR